MMSRLLPRLLAAALLLAAADAAFVGPARCAASRVATPRMGSTADFKTGLTIEFEDQVWKVTEFLHVKPGKGSAFVRSKLKNLQTGQTLEKTWKAGEQFPDAQVDRESMMYSYLDEDDNFVFMNMETYEEEKIPKDSIDKADFIKEEMTLDVLKWRGKAIDVQVPKTVEAKIIETEPGAKGNSAGGRVEKPATIEGGAVINVPIFLTEGETIRVDTDDRKYLGRVND